MAALAAWLLFGSKARSVASLGAILPAAGVGIGRVFSAEGTVTFVFVLVVLRWERDHCVPERVAAVAIGFALAAAIFISGPISGAAVNPVRPLGPMVVAGESHRLVGVPGSADYRRCHCRVRFPRASERARNGPIR